MVGSNLLVAMKLVRTIDSHYSCVVSLSIFRVQNSCDIYHTQLLDKVVSFISFAFFFVFKRSSWNKPRGIKLLLKHYHATRLKSHQSEQISIDIYYSRTNFSTWFFNLKDVLQFFYWKGSFGKMIRVSKLRLNFRRNVGKFFTKVTLNLRKVLLVN